MAKVNGVGSQMSGKVGQLIYRHTKYGTVVYEAPVKASVPQRTEAQMQVRTQLGNLAAVYGQLTSFGAFPPSHLGNSSKLDCTRFGVGLTRL